MSFYKVQATFWQIFLLLFILAAVFLVCGCNGTRFIFSAKKDMVATPAEMGLDFDEVWFNTTDGVQLHGWLIPGPPGSPLVIFFHGNSANITHFVDLLQYINEMGFSAFIFDYRGFGKSHGQLKREEDLYIDGRGAIDYLKKKGWQPSQMIYYGHSLGAAVSLQMGLETPPAAAVLESPFTSMADIAWHTAPVTYALIGWWAIDAEFDNLNKIKNLSVPLVILQGAEDKIVPPKMALRLYKQAREPKMIYFIPNGGHNNLFQVGGKKYKTAWMDLVRNWVSTQNRKVCFGFY
jgi:alpha-beta hydrolase superfamily lysophospholipase